MGIAFGGLKKKKIVLIGLDNAGKTTITYKLKENAVVTTIPTIGFNVAEIKIGSLTLIMWDLGGQERLRNLWSHYLEGANGIIFVIDSADVSRLTSSRGAKEELDNVLSDVKTKGLPLLVLANKQDMKEALPPSEIEKRLKLAEMKNRNYHISGCSATSVIDTGISKGVGWLSQQVQTKKSWSLFRRSSDPPEPTPTTTSSSSSSSSSSSRSVPSSPNDTTSGSTTPHRRTRSQLPTTQQGT